ncbi:hypothetical protein PP175_28430 (plasmid) [Aneurinibacillus sp. Ricciae_BoGa-3]|uniref:hypothetical protein n=1 Tax=Aneurinibacillus sp. Ricciae_BoGa-3 TaxID=3022697 RepID=UPI0023426B66|nr:hypothetical protein [Aneurinibacillus sp. Ricciae_BoGa-3]WCK57119.1 hypothetical protein PP175_28430 [Aneurinibacillus sp. Ricciae_BoGa-3]
MNEEAFRKHIERIKRDGRERGLTEEELSKPTLDGMFGKGKMTNSAKAIHIAEVAYFRGIMKGVRMVREADTPIVLRGQRPANKKGE